MSVNDPSADPPPPNEQSEIGVVHAGPRIRPINPNASTPPKRRIYRLEVAAARGV
jgi:hypothetical protein